MEQQAEDDNGAATPYITPEESLTAAAADALAHLSVSGNSCDENTGPSVSCVSVNLENDQEPAGDASPADKDVLR